MQYLPFIVFFVLLSFLVQFLFGNAQSPLGRLLRPVFMSDSILIQN